jgi:hypothetical protein
MTDRAPVGDFRERICGPELSRALTQVQTLILDGLRHGFFEYTIAGAIGTGGKRQLMIRAGKSHKFTIAEDELPH